MAHLKDKTVMHVVGARPNVMKLGPLYRELSGIKRIRQVVVHSGQHYDPPLMSELFEDFKLPKPDHNLGVGDLSPGIQYGEIILRLTRLFEREKIDTIITYGDVRTTPAAAIAAHHADIPAAHYEGGLRAHNRIWSEEFHRITADAYSDIIFTTEPAAQKNVVDERKSDEGVYLVGDLMCDAARMILEGGNSEAVLHKHGIRPPFVVFTAHHINNVDSKESLERTLDVVETIAKRLPLVYPIHPRPRKRMEEFGLWERFRAVKNLTLLPPLRYAEFIHLAAASAFVASDSGSLSSECAYLGKPMLYLHPVCERVLVVECGAVVITDMQARLVETEMTKILSDGYAINRPELFDGYSARRVARILIDFFNRHP